MDHDTIEWEKPNGNTIVTNSLPATIKYCAELEWVLAGSVTDVMDVTDEVEGVDVPGDGNGAGVTDEADEADGVDIPGDGDAADGGTTDEADGVLAATKKTTAATKKTTAAAKKKAKG